MHALENGIMNDCINVLFKRIGKSRLDELDNLAQNLTKFSRQNQVSHGSDKDMPRLLWLDGVASLTNISASYRVGTLLTIVIISLQYDGIIYFENVLGDRRTLNNMRECFQMVLCYWMWLKRKTYWHREDNEKYSEALGAIRRMLSKIKSIWPRTQGQGWDLPKFHEQLHVPDDILQNGAPAGTHSGPAEHNHIQFVKLPSNRTQKRRKDLDYQIGSRFHETYLINTALQYMEPQHAGESMECKQKTEINKLRGSNGELRLMIKDNFRRALYKRKTMELTNKMLTYILEKYPPVQKRLKTEKYVDIKYFSEYKRNNELFRAHPNYKQEGKWYDWVMIRWQPDQISKQKKDLKKECHVGDSDTDQNNNSGYLYSPGQILCFLTTDKGTNHAIVKCCDYEFERGSVFSNQWNQEYVNLRGERKPRICIIDVQAIVSHALIIPTDENQESYHQIWDKCHWSNEFSFY